MWQTGRQIVMAEKKNQLLKLMFLKSCPNKYEWSINWQVYWKNTGEKQLSSIFHKITDNISVCFISSSFLEKGSEAALIILMENWHLPRVGAAEQPIEWSCPSFPSPLYSSSVYPDGLHRPSITVAAQLSVSCLRLASVYTWLLIFIYSHQELLLTMNKM